MADSDDPRPAVIVFTGLPGTGKSTLADRVAQVIRAPSFSGDWLMGSLAPSGVLRDLDRETFLGLHRGLLGTLARRQLMLGQSAVLDCLVDDGTVARWRELTEEHDARLVVVECRCGDLDVHRGRIEGRRRGIPGWHEVDWAHVERMRDEFPPLSSEHVALDTVGTVEDNLADVLRRLGVTGPQRS